ncbi:MAG: hypothetical protein ACK53L_20000, partial [Pirellulaceae bacterium]
NRSPKQSTLREMPPLPNPLPAKRGEGTKTGQLAASSTLGEGTKISPSPLAPLAPFREAFQASAP